MEEDDDELLGTPVPVSATTPTPQCSVPVVPPAQFVGTQRRLDPKLLDKPECYDGEESGWRIWKLRTTGWLSAVDPRFRHLLGLAERSETKIDEVAEEVAGLDTFLFSQLLAWLEGEQLETLLRGSENHGFEGWRTLVRAQECLEPTRKVAQLESCCTRSSVSVACGAVTGSHGRQNA
jgi:hypothetical protein